MTARRALGLLVLWVLCQGAAIRAALQPATGDGFHRGMDRALSVLGWELAAAVLALVLWIGARHLHGPLRLMARLPGLLALVLVALVLGRVGVALVSGS